ncbi:alanine racemase [Miniphocaeibacter halophilus]|uniref:Alanine racemase n=1 Tax=Miniphocaeibacter halophilus TaxID=2931922 RepID=A0AC61MSA4_9FIRM|nr:alanine racemase [Miniphocaeibacter halophilus]QQK08327.1 alanine racemase [Miniphocaeibacter halophilus]
MSELNTPAVHINMNQVEENIKEIVNNLKEQGIAHRPHIKVHKSVYLAQLQQKLGAEGITVATLGEAEVMANGGISDILLAFPVIGEEKLEGYEKLLKRKGLTIRTVINSIKGANDLSELGLKLNIKIPVLIEVDGGIFRGGVPLGEPLVEFGKNIKDLAGIEVQGILYYGGDIYGLKDIKAMEERSKRESEEIVSAAKSLEEIGFKMDILSGGSSFSVRFPKELKGITEARAGNYIFNDCAQLTTGVIPEEKCALTILATVISRPDENTAIIDAGTKTLSSDLVGFREGYGYIKEDPSIIIHKLNEEHGYLKSENPISFEIGDKINIIPNHACVIPNLAGKVYCMRDDILERVICIEAQSKIQ